MYTSANISIRSISTGMWACRISLYVNTIAGIKETLAFGCSGDREEGLLQNRKCVYRRKSQFQSDRCTSTSLLSCQSLHLPPQHELATQPSASRQRSASSPRSDGGWCTSRHGDGRLNEAVASSVRGDDDEAWRTRLAAVGLNITGCDLKYPAEIHFEVQGVTVFLLEPLPPQSIRHR